MKVCTVAMKGSLSTPPSTPGPVLGHQAEQQAGLGSTAEIRYSISNNQKDQAYLALEQCSCFRYLADRTGCPHLSGQLHRLLHSPDDRSLRQFDIQ